MTKQQISVRVSPDTLAAIDAAAERNGVSRGHIIDRWLTQAAVNDVCVAERIGRLISATDDAIVRASSHFVDDDVLAAIRNLADAVDLLNGTAPE